METYIGTKIISAEPSVGGNHVPVAGYAVTYADGYESWSPKEAFEDAYQRTNAMSFGHAIVMLKAGMRVARAGWNGKGLSLELQVPDAHSKMTLPYIFMRYPDDAANTPGARVPWLASQTDVLADDWTLVD